MCSEQECGHRALPASLLDFADGGLNCSPGDEKIKWRVLISSRWRRIGEQLLRGACTPCPEPFWGARSLDNQWSLRYDAVLGGVGLMLGSGSFPPPGLLAGTCFLLWLFSLHGVTGAYPPPTASPLRREWVWLSLAWKRHRFETISPPAGFSMESSIEDITIYSAQWVYTAWCPPAFQESIPPAWGGRAQLSWGDGASICPAWGEAGVFGWVAPIRPRKDMGFFYLFLHWKTCLPVQRQSYVLSINNIRVLRWGRGVALKHWWCKGVAVHLQSLVWGRSSGLTATYIPKCAPRELCVSWWCVTHHAVLSVHPTSKEHKHCSLLLII